MQRPKFLSALGRPQGFAIDVPTRNCVAHRANGAIEAHPVAAARQSPLRATAIGDAARDPNYKQSLAGRWMGTSDGDDADRGVLRRKM